MARLGLKLIGLILWYPSFDQVKQLKGNVGCKPGRKTSSGSFTLNSSWGGSKTSSDSSSSDSSLKSRAAETFNEGLAWWVALPHCCSDALLQWRLIQHEHNIWTSQSSVSTNAINCTWKFQPCSAASSDVKQPLKRMYPLYTRLQSRVGSQQSLVGNTLMLL